MFFKKKNQIVELPTDAPYPNNPENSWDKIPLGLVKSVDSKGKEFLSEKVWNITTKPHALLVGGVGSGKSIIQRSIIFHCVQNSEQWDLYGIDLKRVELNVYGKYTQSVKSIAKNISESFEVFEHLQEELDNRYERMAESGVNYFVDLENAPKATIVIVDNVIELLTPRDNAKTDEELECETMRTRIRENIESIAILGRAAGIYLVLSAQRPDPGVFNDELLMNLTTRIVMGRTETQASILALDNIKASETPSSIIGRGYMQALGDGEEFQCYYAPQDWMDRKIEETQKLLELKPWEDET